MIKKIHFLISVISVLVLISCNGQIKPIGEAPLDLTNFDFSTKITTLIPEKYKDKKFEVLYNIPSKSFLKSIAIQKDTLFDKEFGENPKAVGFYYHQISSVNVDEFAVYKNRHFNEIDIATDSQNNIFVIGAVAENLTEKETQDFIATLSGKYGKPVKKEKDFFGKYFNYEWNANDRILIFSSVMDKENNNLKIEIDQSNNTIKEGAKEPHLQGYFFVVNKKQKEMIQYLNSGDFVFIN